MLFRQNASLTLSRAVALTAHLAQLCCLSSSKLLCMLEPASTQSCLSAPYAKAQSSYPNTCMKVG